MGTCTCECHCKASNGANMPGVAVEAINGYTGQSKGTKTTDSSGKAEWAGVGETEPIHWKYNQSGSVVAQAVEIGYNAAIEAVEVQVGTITNVSTIRVRVNYSNKLIKIQKVLSGKGGYETLLENQSIANQYVAFGGLPAGTYQIVIGDNASRIKTIVAGQTISEIFTVSAK